MANSNTFLPRKTLSTRLWQDADLWRLWCWCMLKAARKACVVEREGVPIGLRAGELAETFTHICQSTGLQPEAVRASLATGKKLGLLTIRVTPWALRISIVA